MLKSKDMPAPETLVEYEDGSVAAAMFHYAAEGHTFEDIAEENGFHFDFLSLDEDDPLFAEYEDGAGDIPARWRPEIPEGWLFGGVIDSADGPFAVILRRHEDEVASADGAVTAPADPQAVG